MRTNMYSVLEGHTVVPASMVEWVRFFEKFENRIVRVEVVGPRRISTVFLGYNHGGPGDGPDLWFETKVFNGEESEDMLRYETWDEAMAGHKQIVEGLKKTYE